MEKNEPVLIWTNDYEGEWNGQRVLDYLKPYLIDAIFGTSTPDGVIELSDDSLVTITEEVNDKLKQDVLANIESVLAEHDLVYCHVDNDPGLLLVTDSDFEDVMKRFDKFTVWEDGNRDLHLKGTTAEGVKLDGILRILTEEGSMAGLTVGEADIDDPKIALPFEYSGRFMEEEGESPAKAERPVSEKPVNRWFLKAVSSWGWKGEWIPCQDGEIQQAVRAAWCHEAGYHRATPGEPPATAVDFVANDACPGLLAADIHGGLNRHGKWSDYFHALSDVFDTLEKKGYDPRMVDLSVDWSDDVWDALFTIERRMDK